ncbi:AcnD-accessory protein PrpF (fragment) [Cupriavidus taiwanensis]
MGLASSAEEATTARPHTPKLAYVSPPAEYTASNGKVVSTGQIDIVARIFSMGLLHHAMTGTGAVAIAAAGSVPGTVVSTLLGDTRVRKVRFGHPSGTLTVGAEVANKVDTWTVSKVTMSRSARRLMDGHVYVPQVSSGNS